VYVDAILGSRLKAANLFDLGLARRVSQSTRRTRKTNVNCFVIMPFAREFDDVYTHIKMSVEVTVASQSVRCFRLDEARPAGRITDRLLAEIQASNLCVADLTGLKPNIMWEVGYAMALGKPTIIVTQEGGELPFDIKDMHSIQYDRNHLSSTLGIHLKRAVIDTLNTLPSKAAPCIKSDSIQRENLVGELLEQVRDLKSMVSQAVSTWSPPAQQPVEVTPVLRNFSGLEGAWIDLANGTHCYAKVINDELVVPYCYGGNEELTSVFCDWKQTGEYWFARYRWFRGRAFRVLLSKTRHDRPPFRSVVD
jgi:hypothetical protein